MEKEMMGHSISYLRGAKAIGISVENDIDLGAVIKRGLESTVLARLYDMGLQPEGVLNGIQHPESGTLTPHDTLNVLRLAQITSRALGIFNDRESALAWLHGTQAQLGGERPLVVAVRSDDAVQEVETTLSRLDESNPSTPYN